VHRVAAFQKIASRDWVSRRSRTAACSRSRESLATWSKTLSRALASWIAVAASTASPIAPLTRSAASRLRSRKRRMCVPTTRAATTTPRSGTTQIPVMSGLVRRGIATAATAKTTKES